MRITTALIGFFTLTAMYVGVLVWVDARRQVFDSLWILASVMPVLLVTSLCTYVVRYARWRWLLARAGHSTPLGCGFLAYLAGFAFTATPGKVGELVRIRYFKPMGVPASRVIAVFVFERALDLVVVLSLATLSIRDARLLAVAVVFVLICLALLAILGMYPSLLAGLARWLEAARLLRCARLSEVLGNGFVGCRVWLRPTDLALSAALGLVAWGGTALGFVYLIAHLDVTSVPLREGLALYPMAMLAGAASMLPGGIGSTEATITALLARSDVELPVALLAAVGIRLSSLWFAIVCGLVSVTLLEWRGRTNA